MSQSMNWDVIYQDMAFAPYKSDLAEYQKLKDALVTLYCFLQGQAKAYEVKDALGYLEQKYGSGVLMGANFIRKAIAIEDDDAAKEQICYEGISLIERYLRRNCNAN